MRAPRTAVTVTVAFAHTGEVCAWQTFLTKERGEAIDRTLYNLLDVGHVAAFSIEPTLKIIRWSELMAHLRSRCGVETFQACVAAPPCRSEAPAFLMQVWPFDHEIAGAPASTGRLLGLDLELIATPSPDEERGVYLPTRDGLWLIHARPLF